MNRDFRRGFEVGAQPRIVVDALFAVGISTRRRIVQPTLGRACPSAHELAEI